MAITHPPQKIKHSLIAESNEQKIIAVINKGGSVTLESEVEKSIIKQINIKLLSKEIEMINQQRALRPKGRTSKKLGISLHDWIIEAVQEKIERDSKRTTHK